MRIETVTLLGVCVLFYTSFNAKKKENAYWARMKCGQKKTS